jgi:hypothetical protein
MGLMAGYGLHLWPFLQDLGQLKALYTAEVSETFFGNVDAAIFFGNSDPLTLEYVSRRVGNVSPQEVNIEPPKAVFIQSTGQGDSVMAKNITNAAQADYHDEMNQYSALMRVVGTPRLPPEKIASIVGRGKIVAKSMLVFAKGGEVLHLGLKPYFAEASINPLPSSIGSPEYKIQKGTRRKDQESAYLAAWKKVEDEEGLRVLLGLIICAIPIIWFTRESIWNILLSVWNTAIPASFYAPMVIFAGLFWASRTVCHVPYTEDNVKKHPRLMRLQRIWSNFQINNLYTAIGILALASYGIARLIGL